MEQDSSRLDDYKEKNQRVLSFPLAHTHTKKEKK